MRKLVLSLLAVSILSVNFAFSMSDSESTKISKTNDVIEVLKSQIKYPEFAKENNIQGEVLVSLKVDENGKIVVNQINSFSSTMIADVKQQLEQIKVVVNDRLINQLLYIRFSFEIK